ncbi:MAG: guanylate kinase [Fimbriimonadales bacterium]
MPGKIIILSGPSGSGKDTIIAAWMRKNDKVRRVITYTTRKPRKDEIDGIDYHFVAENEFMAMVTSGYFLEHKEVHGRRYASPKDDLFRMVEDGFIAVLKIDVQGALTAMEKFPEAISIFIMPPSVDELSARMKLRGTETREEFDLRMQNAVDEIERARCYSQIVINDNVGRVVDEIEAIIK